MNVSLAVRAVRKKAVWGPRRVVAALTILTLALTASTASAGPRQGRDNDRRSDRGGGKQHPSARARQYRLDPEVERRRDGNPLKTSSVIVTLAPGATLPTEFVPFLRRFNKQGSLDIINGAVLELPNRLIRRLEARPEIFRVHYNRPICVCESADVGHRRRADDARALRIHGIRYRHRGDRLGLHDLARRPDGPDRFRTGISASTKFVDFVSGQSRPYDDNGHGTHVTGIIAGNGHDSYGEKAGIAPDASIISLKVLDADGRGHDRRHHRRAQLGCGEPHDLQHPRRQHVGWRAASRVVLDRPADARHQGSRRSRHRRRGRRGQFREERRTAICSTAASRRRQRAVGADGRRVEHATAPSTRGDDEMAGFSSSGPTCGRLPGQAGSRRARRPGRCRWRSPGSTLYSHQVAIPA